MSTEFTEGDYVALRQWPQSAILKLLCYTDRPDRHRCPQCKNTPSRAGFDDVHLQIVWRDAKSLSAWSVGETVVFSAASLVAPANEMLVLALALKEAGISRS